MKGIGFYFKQIILDRIYRINWIFLLVPHFLEENEEKYPENPVDPVK
jgi:hypothetical protein